MFIIEKLKYLYISARELNWSVQRINLKFLLTYVNLTKEDKNNNLIDICYFIYVQSILNVVETCNIE